MDINLLIPPTLVMGYFSSGNNVNYQKRIKFEQIAIIIFLLIYFTILTGKKLTRNYIAHEYIYE